MRRRASDALDSGRGGCRRTVPGWHENGRAGAPACRNGYARPRAFHGPPKGRESGCSGVSGLGFGRSAPARFGHRGRDPVDSVGDEGGSDHGMAQADVVGVVELDRHRACRPASPRARDCMAATHRCRTWNATATSLGGSGYNRKNSWIRKRGIGVAGRADLRRHRNFRPPPPLPEARSERRGARQWPAGFEAC